MNKSQFFDSSCGNESDHKILVAYASEFGSTKEVAEVIAKVLCQCGALVETKWIKNIRRLDEYDAVIIGSAIQYDKWMPEAIQFVRTNQNIFSALPVAIFFTCMTLSVKTEKTERQAMNYSNKLSELLPQTTVVSIGQFAGALHLNKLSFFPRQIFKIMSVVTGVKQGDYRDWEVIQNWAKDVHSRLNIAH